MNPDTIAIIVTILGAAIALFTLLSRRIDAMEGRLNSRIDALSSRIDSLTSSPPLKDGDSYGAGRDESRLVASAGSC